MTTRIFEGTDGQVPGYLWWAQLRGMTDAIESLVATLDQHSTVEDRAWQILADDPNCEPHILRQYPQRNSESLGYALSGSPNCPDGILEQLCSHPSPIVRAVLAGRRDLSAQAYQTLADTDDGDILRVLAINPALTPSVYQRLAGIPAIAGWVASNPSVPLATLRDLARGAHVESAARNPNLPADIADELWAYVPANQSLACAFAANPSTGQERLEQLYWDRATRRALASNPNCSDTLLFHLAQDGDDSVEYTVAGNPNCPAAALEQLCTNRSPSVVAAAASNPATPVAGLEICADHTNLDVRTSVALNSACPDHLLAALREDAAWRVHTTACAHPNTTTEQLLAQPLWRLASSAINTSLLPSVPVDSVSGLVSMAPDWGGSLSQLLETMQLLSV